MNAAYTVTATIALLALYLIFVTALQHAVEDAFARTRLVMSGFFIFIVATLTAAYWPYASASLIYTGPAFVLGALVGYVVGVREAERRIMAEGLARYLEHFAHVHSDDLTHLRWWSIINFYTVMAALALINLVGLSSIIFKSESWALAACALGAFLLGTVAPYLAHLWSIKYAHAKSSTPSDAQ